MKFFRALIGSCLAVGLTSLTFAQNTGPKDLGAAGQYPQFRTLSGLPGGGFGIRPDGTPGFDGAMGFSTPVGYSLDHWHVSGDLANTSDYLFFRLPHVTGNNSFTHSLGKLAGMVGVPLGKFGALTASYMIVSSIFDHAVSLQYSPPFHADGFGIGFGVQDIRGTRGSGAPGAPGGNGTSRSFYGVVTKQFPHGIYASAGWGSVRFNKGFFNASGLVEKEIKLMVEHDGFNFNEGVAVNASNLFHFKYAGRDTVTTVTVGLVRSKYAFWSINLSL